MGSNVKNKKQQAMPKSEAESFGIKRNPAIRAPRIYLSEEEIIRIMRKETAIKKKIGNLIVSVSAILSCRPFFILIFLPCIKMNHYGFSRKSIWKNLETFP